MTVSPGTFTISFVSKRLDTSIKRLKRRTLQRLGQIFAIHHNGSDYYPLYALDPANGYRPLPVVADILRLFAGSKDSWQVALWFGSVNSYLSGKRPQDVLTEAPEPLLRAARAEAEGLQHG